MFYYQKLNELITKQDINGAVVSFNFFKNSNKHKSWCGGLISIVSIIGAIFFGSTKFFKMIYLDDIVNGSIVKEIDSRGLYISDFR